MNFKFTCDVNCPLYDRGWPDLLECAANGSIDYDQWETVGYSI